MKWIIIPALLLLTACATTKPLETKPIVIDSKPIERPGLNLPPVDQFRANDVDWVIITPDTAEEIFAQMAARGEPVVIFGVTESGYEAIAINNQQALRVILQQQAVINGYREYYLRTDKLIGNHNSSQ